jgi:aubergine-like protein
LFRDGVGDGQLQFAAAHEAAQFLSAFQSIGPSFEPKFTMVVVQKRINTRLFQNVVSFFLLDYFFAVVVVFFLLK